MNGLDIGRHEETLHSSIMDRTLGEFYSEGDNTIVKIKFSHIEPKVVLTFKLSEDLKSIVLYSQKLMKVFSHLHKIIQSIILECLFSTLMVLQKIYRDGL